MPRANIKINPEIILRQAKGIDIVKNTLIGEAPRLSAAFSSLTGTCEKPSRAAFTKNGILTNAIAKAILKRDPIKFIPNDEAVSPITELREINPNNAIPAAE